MFILLLLCYIDIYTTDSDTKVDINYWKHFRYYCHICKLAQTACVRHLRCRLQCVAGHCYYQLSFSLSSFGPGGFRAQCVCNACLRAPCSAWPLLLPSFSLCFSFSLRLLLSVCENLFPPIFWHN